VHADDAGAAHLGHVLHGHPDHAVVEAGAQPGAAAGPVRFGLGTHRLEVELVGGDAVVLRVLGDLLGLLVGLQHVGREDVDRRVVLDRLLEVGEGVVEGDHVLFLHELGEGRVAHPGRGGVDAPGRDAGGDRGPGLGAEVVLERRI